MYMVKMMMMMHVVVVVFSFCGSDDDAVLVERKIVEGETQLQIRCNFSKHLSPVIEWTEMGERSNGVCVLPIINVCIVFCCGDSYSGGATRHLHTATPIKKPPLADFNDGVGEHHAGETGTFGSEVSTNCV